MLSKLTPLHIHLIGFFMCLVIAGVLFGVAIKPRKDDLEKVTAETAGLQTSQNGTEEAVAQHKKDLAREQAAKVKTEDDWKLASADYMPDLVFAPNVFDSYNNTMLTIPRKWGTWVGAWYDSQRNLGINRAVGVEFDVPSLPTNPNAISDIHYLVFPSQGSSWPVTVEAKTFDKLMDHLRRVNTTMRKHGMPVINNVSLSGQSPNLTASYNLALYVISATPTPPKNGKIPEAGGAAAGAGGFGGARMGGMPGMPTMGGAMSGMPPGMSGPPPGMAGPGAAPGGGGGGPRGGGRAKME